MTIYQNVGNNLGRANVLRRLGNLWRDRDEGSRPEKALAFYEEAKTIDRNRIERNERNVRMY